MYSSVRLAMLGGLRVVGIVARLGRHIGGDLYIDSIYLSDDALLEEVGGNGQAQRQHTSDQEAKVRWEL